eukprot:CAMPEP_0115019374 /NCGR_PEP_ID=MMETSP0216-20121206/29404_1 /TAXON_ID=223996 /ORGANISM="Protocruzia adherens, Strain Boccale" /LENGTH=155 /DNA_ID=CAMNT_0002390829 /DNA_START=24 /DNA_END=491 /DNA_ORIENTATION=-
MKASSGQTTAIAGEIKEEHDSEHMNMAETIQLIKDLKDNEDVLSKETHSIILQELEQELRVLHWLKLSNKAAMKGQMILAKIKQANNNPEDRENLNEAISSAVRRSDLQRFLYQNAPKPKTVKKKIKSSASKSTGATTTGTNPPSSRTGMMKKKQ